MDSSVIRSLQSNGVEELARIFSQFRSQIRELVQLRLDKRIKSRVDPSDIVQETYIRACRGLDNYLEDPQVPPVVWLRKIGKQIVAETHRKQFRSVRTPRKELNWDLQDDNQLIRFIAESAESIRSKIAKAELAQRVKGHLSDLSVIDREIIEMRHIDGMTIQETAEAIGISSEAAKKRYQRAIQRFKRLVELAVD
ncbi:MAG: sigma-70 family RNA polymerase sigma factor [Pirellulaceae bacterium]